MQITWHADAYVLVQQWKTSTLLGLVFACACACICGIVYELMGHVIQARRSQNWKQSSSTGRNSRTPSSTSRLAISTLHTLRVVISYVIMLFLMTYNAWVIISIIVGSSLGYFLVAPWIRLQVKSQTAPAKTENPDEHSDSAGVCNSSGLLLNQSNYSETDDAPGCASTSEFIGQDPRQTLLTNRGLVEENDDINVVLGFTSAKSNQGS